MTTFKPEPPRLDGESTAQTLDAWIGEAPLTHRKVEDDKPWKRFRRADKPVHRFVVELNDFERELLRAAAQLAGRSMQKEARRLLIGALERSMGTASRRHPRDVG